MAFYCALRKSKEMKSKSILKLFTLIMTIAMALSSLQIVKAVANRTYEYGQRIIFDTDRDNWTFTGGTFNENQLWLINGSTLVLDADNAKIVNPITVEIPFTVVEDLDPFGVAAADRQGTVKVTFTSEK